MQSVLLGQDSTVALSEFESRWSGLEDKKLKAFENLAQQAWMFGMVQELEQMLAVIDEIDEDSEAAQSIRDSDIPPTENPQEDYQKFQTELAKTQKQLCEQYVRLARWAKSKTLDAQSKRCVDAALLLAPNNIQLRKEFLNEAYLFGYGWKDLDFVKKYNSGLRLIDDNWKPAAEVAIRRRRWQFAWQLESAHWQIKTNCSEAVAIKILQLLEAVHDRFKADFGDVFEFKPLAEKMKINLYRSKSELANALKKVSSTINTATTIGNYSFRTGESYYYYFETNNTSRDTSTTFTATCIHESIHQLCDKLIGVSRFAGQKPNFWVIEGFADYVALSFSYNSAEPQRSMIGSLPLFRQSSRWKYLAQTGGVYNTLDFVAQNQAQFVSNDIAIQYSQSATLAYFLMEGSGRLYRKRFKQYIKLVFAGESTATSFATIFGKDSASIHTKYLKFLKNN